MGHALPSLEHCWLPFTPNRDFRKAPRLLAEARGTVYRTPDGREILDGLSGLFCAPAGHGRPEIAEAIRQQALELSYAPSFQHGHPRAFELAERLAELLPEGLDRVFFTNSGSESVDTALKIALAYHRARGEGQRVRLVGRERGYHGVNFGGISVGGMGPNRAAYGPGLAGVSHLRHTWLPENRMQRGRPREGAWLADDLERLVQLHGDTLAAVIVEPVAGSTGCLPPPAGYLERLREICDRHGILLIFDEVICGFGRLGAAFAADRFGVRPDLITLAKALTNGTVPMGAVAVRRDIAEAIEEAASPGRIEFFHGYTCSGHPVACAAALAALDIYREEGLFERARELETTFLDAVFGLGDLQGVSDIRGIGLLAGLDLEPDGPPGARGQRAVEELFEAGVFARVSGDALLLAPAFVSTPEHIAAVVERVRGVLARASR